MNTVPAIGAATLGVVIGWLVRYFIRRFSSFSPKILGAVVGIMLGGVVLKFLQVDRSGWWFYPIGLAIGFAIYQIIAMKTVRPQDGPIPKDHPYIKKPD